jgi:hypothetical protein
MLIVQKHFRHREDDAYSSRITKLTRTQLSITGVRERQTPTFKGSSHSYPWMNIFLKNLCHSRLTNWNQWCKLSNSVGDTWMTSAKTNQSGWMLNLASYKTRTLEAWPSYSNNTWKYIYNRPSICGTQQFGIQRLPNTSTTGEIWCKLLMPCSKVHSTAICLLYILR